MKPVARDRMPVYLDRADTYYRALEPVNGNPGYEEAVPLLAVHMAISLTDAILCLG